jgi:hypothetical protein
MKKVAFLVAVCCVTATACSDRPAEDSVAGPSFQNTASACLSSSAIEDGIRAIFPSGGDRSSALSRFRQIQNEVGTRPPGPDTATAQKHALSLVDFLLKKYQDGRLIGGQSVQTQAALAQVLNGILCTAGLEPVFGPGSLGPDGAAAFIYPTTPDTTVVTETEWAGVHIPAASVTVPTLVTIQRLPDFPGPLLTQLDQYPIYYEFHSTSSTFTNDVVVGICVADNVVPPDPSRLRLAHNVAPYTMGSIEILPLAQAPFLDCSDAPIAAGPSRWGFDLARARGWLERETARLLLPQPAYAFGIGGVGGTVRTFSPFGAVDTLVIMSPSVRTNSGFSRQGSGVDDPPQVQLLTPAGHPVSALPVTFVVTGGGTLTGAAPVTDAGGYAGSTAWLLGPGPLNTVTVTAQPGQGWGISGNSVVFTAYTLR